MNLALDFGNTRIKAAAFNGYELIRHHVFSSPAELLNSDVFHDIQNCIICSVTNFHVPVVEQMGKKLKLLLFKPNTPVPLKNLYRSALTLGSDRLAAAVGAVRHYPAENVLIIDAGTCLKYNFVNSSGEYLGGAISPGIPMRLKAMNHFTQRLPLPEPRKDFSVLVGQTTDDSLLSGSVIAAACEADGMIDRYREKYHDLRVILTGGDAPYLSGQLKNSFFAHQNLLLQGLNAILQFNLEK